MGVVLYLALLMALCAGGTVHHIRNERTLAAEKARRHAARGMVRRNTADLVKHEAESAEAVLARLRMSQFSASPLLGTVEEVAGELRAVEQDLRV